MPILPIHKLLKRRIHQALLLQHPQPPELLAHDINSVHAAAAAAYVLDLELGRLELFAEYLVDAELGSGEVWWWERHWWNGRDGRGVAVYVDCAYYWAVGCVWFRVAGGEEAGSWDGGVWCCYAENGRP